MVVGPAASFGCATPSWGVTYGSPVRISSIMACTLHANSCSAIHSTVNARYNDCLGHQNFGPGNELLL